MAKQNDTPNVVDGRYLVTHFLGAGGFGKVSAAIDNQTGQEVALKISSFRRIRPMEDEGESPPIAALAAPQKSGPPTTIPTSCEELLQTEYFALKHLQNHRGFPDVYKLGKHVTIKNNYTIEATYLAMEQLGKPLDKLFSEREKHFSLKTVLIMMDQLLSRLFVLQSKGIIHGDIKPANILIGTGENSGVVYLIDFGLSTMYIDRDTGMHVAYQESKRMQGTILFMSCHAHKRIQQTRRDDLESLAYVMAYLVRYGDLPWKKLEREGEDVKVGRMKKLIKAETLFGAVPREFAIFYDVVRNLKFDDNPPYKQFRNLFRKLGRILGVQYSDSDDTWKSFARLPF